MLFYDADGQPGPAGLVAAFSAAASGGSSGTPLGSFIVGDLLTSVTLPAGNWAIFSRVKISQDTSPESVATCSVKLVTAALTADTVHISESAPSTAFTPSSNIISMMALSALPAWDTVELRCNDSLSQPSIWSDAKIVAVQVTTIN